MEIDESCVQILNLNLPVASMSPRRFAEQQALSFEEQVDTHNEQAPIPSFSPRQHPASYSLRNL